MINFSRIADPNLYSDDKQQYEIYRVLRESEPVKRIHAPGYRPFWAVSRAADIRFVESSTESFLAGPRTVLLPIEAEAHNLKLTGDINGLRALTHMDGMVHRQYRDLTRNYFSPRAILQLQGQIEATAKTFVDMLQDRHTVDFAADVAFWFPLRIIMQLLGVPNEDEGLILGYTQALFGYEDTEFGDSALSPAERLAAANMGLRNYFSAMTEDRRKTPRDDIASLIANARIEENYLEFSDLLSYFIIIATAGHDTTSSTIAGGLKALIENPSEMQKLRDDPALVNSAVNEMIRWVAPVKHFLRTATKDVPLAGKIIPAGETVMSLYASGCRDADEFEQADSFRVDREPNKHLAFGFGPHVCLGMHLAKLEIAVFYQQLLPRMRKIDLAGEPEFMQSTFVSGLKRLPITIRF